MTQNEKDLLIKDLCSRLPHGLRVVYKCNQIHEVRAILKSGMILLSDISTYELITTNIENVRPYLLPLSSMTAEQKTSHNFLKHSAYANPVKLIDWYIKNNFDYRGLIPMGLAIDATGLNIY